MRVFAAGAVKRIFFPVYRISQLPFPNRAGDTIQTWKVPEGSLER